MQQFRNRVIARAAAAAGLALALAPAPASAARYAFDKANTEIRFTWDHLGLSRQSGRFLDVEGTVEFDPDVPEAGSVEVRIKTASLATGSAELDRLLRSADFFNAAQYPFIAFQSTSATAASAKTGAVVGDLTMLGITKPVALTLQWNFTGEHPLAKLNARYKDLIVSGFSGTATILRSEWGMSRGLPLVADEIQITIEAEAIRKADDRGDLTAVKARSPSE
jgi:polyisoprenoid-binding protein YceI